MIDRINAFIDDKHNRIPLLIILALLIPLGLIAVLNDLGYAIGYDPASMFFKPDDRFADLLKAAMSYTSIMTGLSDAQIQEWPELYRYFLTVHPDYQGIPMTHYNMPPFGALLHIAAAEIIVAFDPDTALWASISLYLALVVFMTVLLRRFYQVSLMDQVAVFFVLFLSYPALFMLTRGNLLAGYTTLCLVVYALTAIKGRYRWLGMLCLAAAINLRPNTITFCLLELIAERRWYFTISAVAFLSFMLAFLSYMLVQTVDPFYTLDKFREALGFYKIAYVQGDYGFEWNFSLYGTTRVLRDLWEFQNNHSEFCFRIVDVLGLASAAATAFLAFTRRLTVVQAAFLATALSCLFTPVFAFYHVTEFAIPLIAILAIKGRGAKIQPDNRLIFVTCLLCLCPLNARETLYPLFIFAVTVTILIQAARQTDYRRQESVVQV